MCKNLQHRKAPSPPSSWHTAAYENIKKLDWFYLGLVVATSGEVIFKMAPEGVVYEV